MNPAVFSASFIDLRYKAVPGGSEVDKWLTRHPNVTFHITPRPGFGIIIKQAIR